MRAAASIGAALLPLVPMDFAIEFANPGLRTGYHLT